MIKKKKSRFQTFKNYLEQLHCIIWVEGLNIQRDHRYSTMIQRKPLKDILDLANNRPRKGLSDPTYSFYRSRDSVCEVTYVEW